MASFEFQPKNGLFDEESRKDWAINGIFQQLIYDYFLLKEGSLKNVGGVPRMRNFQKRIKKESHGWGR